MLLDHDLDGPPGAPPIVLVHGITECRAAWGTVAEALAVDHRVLAVDLRGHGASPPGDTYDPAAYAGDVIDTATAAGLVDPLVVGHSLGGVVATAYAALGSCCAVVDVDQPLHLAGFKTALTALAPMLRGSPGQFRAAIDAMFAQLRGPLGDGEAARLEALRRPDQDVVLGTWSAVLDLDADALDATIRTLSAEVHVPFLSLHGIDPGPDYPRWLRGQIPQAVVEVWPEHGHYPHLVDPPRFVDRLSRFEREACR